MSRYAFSIGRGWLPLVQDLIEELIQAGWNKQITQVKEKFGCYDEDTEVLTEEGWKYFKDCNLDLKVATLDKDGYMKYQCPTDKISYPYCGLMYKLKTRGVDLLVTPNHALYIAKGGWVGRYNKLKGTKRHGYKLRTTAELFRRPKRFKKSFRWEGSLKDVVGVKGYSYFNKHRNGKLRHYTRPDASYDVDSFYVFLGFMLQKDMLTKSKEI